MKTLAHHLIQSCVSEKVCFQKNHLIGIELYDNILEKKYEYVVFTHIDKDYIYNYIIFNSIAVD